MGALGGGLKRHLSRRRLSDRRIRLPRLGLRENEISEFWGVGKPFPVMVEAGETGVQIALVNHGLATPERHPPQDHQGLRIHTPNLAYPSGNVDRQANLDKPVTTHEVDAAPRVGWG